MAVGEYLVFEGGEGAGKNLQAKKVMEALERRGKETRFIEEPGGEPTALLIRSLLKKDPSDPFFDLLKDFSPQIADRNYFLTPRAEVFLFNAARTLVLENVVVPALAEGIWVISGRNYLSTLAYQCYGRGFDLEEGRMICGAGAAAVSPDLMLLLSVEPALALGRRSARKQTDQFEAEGLAFHERVHRGYLLEARQQRIPVIDASGTPDEVFDQIWRHIEPLLEV